MISTIRPTYQTWVSLCKNFTQNDGLINQYWNELLSNYTSYKRHYHSIVHIEQLLAFYFTYENLIADKNAVLFSIFYHDVIYNTLKKNNEEKSALKAKSQLLTICEDAFLIEKIVTYILATQQHEPTADTDLQFLLDIDLSILGSDESIYKNYIQQIRNEYSIYPDFLYNNGRKKSIETFFR
jgi:predicted metal-dependent HD superfamily phosphohydrolase